MSRDTFKKIEKEMNQMFLERGDEIKGLLVALIAKVNIIFLGPPGTAKSEMTDNLCQRLAGKLFDLLMTRYTKPEEVFGPPSLKALENDEYKYVTDDMLPEADIAFLDEIFKANSAILNALLKIVNEHIFQNGKTKVSVPLQMLVGASNEMPEDREELGALWDRFILRYQTAYIKDPRNFEALLKRTGPVTTTTLDKAQLDQARAEAEAVGIDRIVPQLYALRNQVMQMNIEVSDRRWRQCLGVIKAHAWLEGRTEAEDADLEILAHVLWQEPEQIAQVRQSIMALANPLDQEALDLQDQAMEVWQKAVNAPEEEKTDAGREGNTKLRQIVKRLDELKKQAEAAGKSDARIQEILSKTVSWNEDVLDKCLGLTI